MSNQRFLLYLDILGFKQLAKTPSRVRELYYIINSLHVHRDGVFKAIVFSDTLLFYSPTQIHARNRTGEMMFLCEFVQQLLHRTTGRGFYFRGFITFGEFRVEDFRHFKAFYGRGLVAAYQREQTLKSAGLFIDDYSNQYNKAFHTRSYSDDCSFVYLLQALDRIDRDRSGMAYPAIGELIFDTGVEYSLIWEIHMLQDVHEKMTSHPDPDVRAKFLVTWSFYHQQYPELTDELVAGQFAPESVLTFDWTDAEAAYQRDRKERYRAKVWTGG